MQQQQDLPSFDQLNIHIKRNESLAENEELDLGENSTYIAMKSINSFLVASYYKTLVVVQDEKILFKGKPTDDPNFEVTGALYAAAEDCYFLTSFQQKRVYKKAIDGQEPEVFLDGHAVGWMNGRAPKYSLKNNALVMDHNQKNLLIVSAQDPSKRIEINQDLTDNIKDFKIYGKDENKVAALTYDGWVLLYQYDIQAGTGEIVGRHRLDILNNQDRKEEGLSLCIGPGGEHILVHLRDYKNIFGAKASRFFVLKINPESADLLQTSKVDIYAQNLKQFYCVDCLGHPDGHLIFIALSDRDFVCTLDYNCETGELSEMDHLRRDYQETFPKAVVKFGNVFYSVGHHAKILEIKYYNE